jgi:hypothetical protein
MDKREFKRILTVNHVVGVTWTMMTVAFGEMKIFNIAAKVHRQYRYVFSAIVSRAQLVALQLALWLDKTAWGHVTMISLSLYHISKKKH